MKACLNVPNLDALRVSKYIKLEPHLDVGDHCIKDERPSETLYDKLRRDWADGFTKSVNVTEDEQSKPNIL